MHDSINEEIKKISPRDIGRERNKEGKKASMKERKKNREKDREKESGKRWRYRSIDPAREKASKMVRELEIDTPAAQQE